MDDTQYISTHELKNTIHDFRNTLNRVSMQAELAKMMLNQGLPAEKAIEAIDKAIAGCQKCSEQLNDFSLGGPQK